MGHFLLAYYSSVLVAALLHETAHLVAAFSLNVKVKSVGISWRGPYIVRQAGPPLENTIVSLAGPGINLLLCMVSYHVAPAFAFANGFLGIFNLLPFIPMSDGQRVYRLWTQRATAAS